MSILALLKAILVPTKPIPLVKINGVRSNPFHPIVKALTPNTATKIVINIANINSIN